MQESFIGELTEENLKILNESLNLDNLQQNESMISKLKKRKVLGKENKNPNISIVTTMKKLSIEPNSKFPKKRKFSFATKMNSTFLAPNEISFKDMLVLSEY